MANWSPTPYSVIVFNKDKAIQPIKLRFVKGIYYVHNWLIKVKYDYHYMNIYERKTGRYISRQYCNEYVIDKPPL
jgi:hypothetical protein